MIAVDGYRSLRSWHHPFPQRPQHHAVIDHRVADRAGHQIAGVLPSAIGKRPDVLLCDEPTGALDVKTGVVVLEAIARINKELGTLTAVITHNAAIAQMADRVIHLSDGRIATVVTNTERKPAKEIVW